MSEYIPTTEAEASDLVRAQAAIGKPLTIAGGNTRAGPGNIMQNEATLRSTGLCGIIAYNPNEMVMTVRAGTPVAEVEAELAAAGQMIAFEPMDHRGLLGTTGEPTIGGVFAANVSGPRRFVAGAARDSLLGVRFINGRGEIVKNGGRVMKNVTGLDLVKLLAGSFGTLGFLTELTFRVPPRPKGEQSIVISGLSDEEATRAMARAVALPVEVSGAAHLPPTLAGNVVGGDLPSGGATILRLEGLPNSLEVRAEKLCMAMSQFGDVTVVEQDVSRKIWQQIRDVQPYADGSTRPVWRVSVAPSVGHKLVAALRPDGVDAFYDWQGGLAWLRMQQELEPDLLRRLIKALGGGHATLIRASNSARTAARQFQFEGDAVAALSSRVKATFDPSNIFNPGRMAGS